MTHTPNEQIEAYHPVDGDFYLVHTREGRLLAKTWNMNDARLIAAAPDLLAACKTLLGCMNARAWTVGEIRQAQAAIAKAEGRV